ncbi:MAG: associated Golgi protein [Verrucomicrobia bacterium]|nr:associated Golgi protein [Verrucomicrobiota bacterium]
MKLRTPRTRRRPAPAKPALLPSLKTLADHPHFRRIAIVTALVIGGVALAYHFIDVDAVHAYAARVNPFVSFALLTVLPFVGFPVNILHVAAGVRFGFGLGLALVTLSIFLQLLACFAIVHLWPRLFARRLAKIRARIPPAAHGTVCVFTLLLPGVPFVLQNCTLALIGVPLRTYLSRCLPLHTLRAVVTVGLGQQSGHFTPAGVTLLILYWILILGASWWTYRRLQGQLAGRPSAAGGRMQPA